MKENSLDPRMKIFVLVFVVVIALAGLILYFGESGGANNSADSPKLVLSETNYDFGAIPMSKGTVKHEFTVKNEGVSSLKLTEINTSCMCTTAVLVNNGKRSPEFGMPGHGGGPLLWSDEITPGQSAILEVTFDPNAHGPDAVGPVTRNINIFSNTGGKENTRSVITFSGNVTK